MRLGRESSGVLLAMLWSLACLLEFLGGQHCVCVHACVCVCAGNELGRAVLPLCQGGLTL